ncbi:MAG TPA: membrane protein insertase YidC [Candidatus Desulfofervidus auxilii]|uniref:Membrane protein insertase YidC n=2 Tax=Desulfofervidus auxilii TaxID=1621989 RepID=A0A7V1I4K1_DESA2|nr:membrane protein insertase YidC [Candidatus Desulfofervidus auxilii]
MAYRALLAFVISILILVLYNYFFPPQRPVVKKSTPPSASLQKQEDKSEEKNIVLPSSLEKSYKVKNLGREITVSTPLYQTIFYESGAVIKSFILKKYRQNVAPDSPLQEIIEAKPPYLPLSIDFLQHKDFLKDVKFQADKHTMNLTSQDTPQSLTFTAEVNGIIIKKTFVFYPDSYEIDFDLSLINRTQRPFQDNLAISLANKWPKRERYGFYGGIVLINGQFEEIKWKKIKSQVVKSGNIQWAGLSDKYFATIIVNKDAPKASFIVNKQKEHLVANLLIPPVEVESQKEKTASFLLYFGPKELDRLKKLGFHLDKAVDFGFFDIIAKPLLYILRWFYKYVHNYGIAIILLTVVIKVLFWPLTHTSYKSMQEMQKLQPHINRLREKYKDDKERLNKELMNIYKTYKVNPLGGCLPIILQIPVFFALYKALLYAIELRHANFITYLPFTDKIWLADLSAKDPYYITPILMGISMVIQQKMTPSAMGPGQSKFMLLMPVFFTFLFLNFPSGLVIYWLVNNLLSIVQQFYINRKMQ